MDKDMMDDILAIAKESYNQECNRNNNLPSYIQNKLKRGNIAA